MSQKMPLEKREALQAVQVAWQQVLLREPQTIAADMRLKVYELMQQGQSKDQIIAYMVARYGHFVSYEPPLTAGTLLLWLVPGLFVIAGVALLVARTRRRGGASAALSEQERQRLAALLNKGED